MTATSEKLAPIFNGPCIIVVGPTASGKSDLVMRLAESIPSEIISCDSVQVYRGFDIGAAKPSAEEQTQVPHHLIDVVDCQTGYDASDFGKQALARLVEIVGRGKVPIVVGGTGLYLNALWGQGWHDLPKDEELRQTIAQMSHEEVYAKLQQLDPERAKELHFNDRYRLSRSLELAMLTKKPFSQLANTETRPQFGHLIRILPPRAWLHSKIKTRTQIMLQLGLVAEVERLLQSGCDENCKPMQSIGYKQVVNWLNGPSRSRIVLEEEIMAATRQYAKRQYTWFRKLSSDQTITHVEDEWRDVQKNINLYLKKQSDGAM